MEIVKDEVKTVVRSIDQTIHTTFVGVVTGAMANQLLFDLQRLVPPGMSETAKPTLWVVDTLNVVTFNALEIRPVGVQILKLVKERIGKHFILINTSDAVSMFANALAFGAGMKLHRATTTREADKLVNDLRGLTSVGGV